MGRASLGSVAPPTPGQLLADLEEIRARLGRGERRVAGWSAAFERFSERLHVAQWEAPPDAGEADERIAGLAHRVGRVERRRELGLEPR